MNNKLLEVQSLLCETVDKVEIPRAQSPDFASDWYRFIQDHFQISQ